MFDKKKYAVEYRLKNRDYFRNYNIEWKKNNMERYRTSQNNWFKNYREINRKNIFSILGDRCIMCGFSDPRALQIDHINGGGNKEKKRLGNCDKIVSYYLKHQEEIKDKIQLLCANCNWIKKSENKEHRKNIL
jgi:hypothetical protein